MRGNKPVAWICIIIFLLSIFLLINISTTVTSTPAEPNAIMLLQLSEDLKITPGNSTHYEISVENATREGLIGIGIIPYDTDLWREVGTWSTEPLLKDLELIQSASTLIFLMDPEGCIADIRMRFYIDGDQIGETMHIEDAQVEEEPKLFCNHTDVDGIIVPQGSSLEFRVDIKAVSDTCLFLGGYSGSFVYLRTSPLEITDIQYNDGQVEVTLEEAFGIPISELSIGVHIDREEAEGPAIERNNEAITIQFEKTLPDGTYTVYLNIKYSGGSGFFPYASFNVGTTQDGGDDDDDDWPDDDDDDDSDDDDWYDDDDDDYWNDEEEYDFELLDASVCVRQYSDEPNDDIAYNIKGEIDDEDYETDVDVDRRSSVDIISVEVAREGDDLVVSVELASNSEDTLVSVYFVRESYKQPKICIDDNFEEAPSQEPDSTQAQATSLGYSDIPNWYCSKSNNGNTVQIRGSLGELMELGVTDTFQVFVSTFDMDLLGTIDLEYVDMWVYMDYAGHGAYTLSAGDIGHIENKDGSPETFWNDYGATIIGAVVLFIILTMVIVVVIVKKRKRV